MFFVWRHRESLRERERDRAKVRLRQAESKEQVLLVRVISTEHFANTQEKFRRKNKGYLP